MKCSVVVLASAILIGTISHAQAESPDVKAATPDQAKIDLVQHKVLSFDLEGLTDKGDKKWEVKGESAEAVSENEVKMNNIVAKAYGDEAQATITADKGVYNKSKNNVKLEENVNATIESEQSFGDDYMGFPGAAGATPGQAGTLKTNVKKKTRTVITCDADVQFDYENNVAYFNKNVNVVSEDFRIYSDRITVLLDPATKRVKEIIADGNVKITRGENITYSDKATYVESEKKVILTGRPRLVIYQEGGIEGNFLGK